MIPFAGKWGLRSDGSFGDGSCPIKLFVGVFIESGLTGVAQKKMRSKGCLRRKR